MLSTRLTTTLKNILLAVLIVLACALTGVTAQAYFFVRDTRQAIISDPRGVTGLMANTNAILLQLGITTGTIRRASEEQTHYWKEMSKEGIQTLKKSTATLSEANLTLQDLRRDGKAVVDNTAMATASLTKLLDSTEVVVARTGTGVIPRVEQNLDASRGLLEASSATVTRTGDNIERVVLASDTLLRLPAWEQTANNLALTSANVTIATGNVADTTGYIKNMFNPTKKTFWSNLTAQIIPSIVRLAVPASGIIWNSPTVNVGNGNEQPKKQ